jgi:hypothetical protein
VPEDSSDPVGCADRVLVFPYSGYGPTCPLQQLLLMMVPDDVESELQLPERPVRDWHSSVQIAGVPEAAVDEHGNPRPDEDNIRPHRISADRNATMLTVSEAEGEQR